MDFDKVGKNTDFFSFVKTIADIGSNKEFTEGYRALTSGDTVNLNEKSFVWYGLSAISETVGNTIYENVLNYIDNVANIDVCKVKALASMSKVLGVSNNGILETIDRMPNDVLRLVDIFSINKSYLTDPNVVGFELLYSVMEKVKGNEEYQTKLAETKARAIEALSGFDPNEISVKSNIPDSIYRDFVYESFYDLLSEKVNLTYDGQEHTSEVDNQEYRIFHNLVSRWNSGSNGTSIPSFCFYDAIDLDSDWRGHIDSLKNVYGLKNFDPFTVASAISDGKDSLENYSGAKVLVLQEVFKHRNAQKFSNDHLTKYAYYHEKEVVEYLHYIDSQYIFSKTGSYNLLSSAKIYDLDQNFLEFSDSDISGTWISETVVDPSGQDPSIRTEVIKSVAEILTDLCFGISDIREKLKTQSQRNYMRGTFLLISYVISEYLKKNLPLQYPELSPYLSNYSYLMPSSEDGWAVDIQEYIDTTEYYNLSTDTSKSALNGNTVNVPFWLDQNTEVAGNGIPLSDIDQFYLSTLNLKTATDQTSSFLNVIYELGADRSYIDKDSGSKVVGCVNDHLDEAVQNGEFPKEDFERLSSYQNSILLNYSGQDIGFDPYYNWKNTAHPSYQVHPYLPRFVEYSNIVEAIKNSFVYDANRDLITVLHSAELSTVLGEVGQILNIWDNGATTLHGWKSRYESNTHTQITDYGKISPLQHYDGIFFPQAIDEFIDSANDPTKFSELLSSVSELSSGQNIADFMIQSVSRSNDFDHNPLGLFDGIFQYACQIVRLENEIKSISASDLNAEAQIAELSSQLQELKSVGPEKTYYEKWYSHLDLQKPDCQKISSQLKLFKDDILDLARAREKDSETYDIYKYGLDRYSNSFVLFKKYRLDSTIQEKRDTKGEIWFRFNSHPIGFPLFVGKDHLEQSQVNLENMDRDFVDLLENWSRKRLDQVFYDFDFTSDYRAIILAYDEQNPDQKLGSYSKVKKFLLAKPYQDIGKYDQDGNRLLDFQLKSYSNYQSHYYTSSDVTEEYEFQGLYQDDLYVQAIWTKLDPTSLSIARTKFPDQTTAYRSTFSLYAGDTNESRYCLNLTTRLSPASEIKIGYVNNQYTIAALTETENQHLATMTYVGANTNITSSDSDLDEIKNGVYGRNVEFFLSATQTGDENNSIDRFSRYLTLITFKNSHFEGTAGLPGSTESRITPKNYNLNSDASYLPLYAGLLGFSRIWATNFYGKKPIQSLELLGYSFNAFQEKIDDFSKSIKVDEDGISSSTDIKELLNSVFRVYEQYDNGKDYFLASYNDVLRSSEDQNYRWSIDLSDLVGLGNNGADYKIQVYNISKSSTSPILNCPLSAISDGIQYLSSGSIADDFFLSHNYILPYTENVVGTPNVFEYQFDPNTAAGQTNYVFNVSGIKVVPSYDQGSQKLEFVFETQVKDKDYIIDRGELLAIVYKDDLRCLENYHMLMAHDEWPNLSVDQTVFDDPSRKVRFGEDDFIRTSDSDYRSFTEKTKEIFETNLSDFTDPTQIPALESGTYSFKINEEAPDNGIKFPGGNVVDELEKIFRSTNTQTNELCSIFGLHNTYIFELDRPKEFAELIGSVKMGIYSDSEECVRVYEDYISALHSVSKFKAEIMGYAHFYEGDVDVVGEYVGPTVLEHNTLEELDPSYTPQETELSDVANSSDPRTNWMYIKSDDTNTNDDVSYVIDHKVTEDEIKDFLKLYVNYRVDPDGNIDLYFNYNNFFCTPYSYRNKFGDFVPTYKDGTFLHLKSGETGILNIIIQLKYHNSNGVVCAVKDVPILVYKIKNVSDDKPKFVILKTWTLTPELVGSVKGLALEESRATLQVMEREYQPDELINGFPLSSYLNEDFTVSRDFVVKTNFTILANDFGSAKYRLVYEYSIPEIEFSALDSRNPGSNFSVSKSNVDIETTKTDFQVAFTVKKGAVIDEDTASLYIPLDAINFKAQNSVGSEIKNLTVNSGGIRCWFGPATSQYHLLGKEKLDGQFNGFILGENGKVIRLFQNKG